MANIDEQDGTADTQKKIAGKKKAAKKKKRRTKKKATTRRKAARKKRASKKVSTGKSSRPYPNRTLEEALVVPQAIRDKNNGHPWASEDVSQASLGIKKSNNRFYYVAAASRDYGLTIGTRDTEKIELAELGRAIVFAGDEQTARQKKIDAFFSIDIFKRVFDHYGGSALPQKEFLQNTLLDEFSLAAEFHDDFAKIFKANCKYLAIEKGIGEGVIVKPTEKTDHPSEIRVVGEPKGKFDRTAFVIMPFVEKGQKPRASGFFNEVLTTLITPAANAAGFAVETANKDGSDVIQSTIINQLLTAELVVADLSDHNPNVLFELGIRIAKKLPVALIKVEGTSRIFDVDNMMRVLPYSPNLWPTTVAQDIPRLTDHIKAAWDNRTTARGYMQILTGQSSH